MVKARNSPKNKKNAAKYPMKNGGGHCETKHKAKKKSPKKHAKKHNAKKKSPKRKGGHSGHKKQTPWMKHLMSVYNAGKAQGQSFAQAMKAAKKTYKK